MGSVRLLGVKRQGMGKKTKSRRRGPSLVDLSVVIAIVGIVALMAVPNLSSHQGQQLQSVASDLADALRYARNESLRTGSRHGILVDAEGTESRHDRVVVYRVNPHDPFDFRDVRYHPVHKQFHDLRLTTARTAQGISIINVLPPFNIEGIGRTKQLHFDANGRPVYTQQELSFPMLSGEIHLSNGAANLSVSVAPMTGKVSIHQ